MASSSSVSPLASSPSSRTKTRAKSSKAAAVTPGRFTSTTRTPPSPLSSTSSKAAAVTPGRSTFTTITPSSSLSSTSSKAAVMSTSTTPSSSLLSTPSSVPGKEMVLID